MRKYTEFSYEKMSRDYEMYQEIEEVHDKLEGIYEEDDKKQYSDTTSIQYIQTENYDVYEEVFKINGSLIKKKDDAYILDMMLYYCDYFCKLVIFYYVHKYDTEKYTPKWLYDEGLISSGRYTSWKGVFMESIFSEIFDVQRKEYKISGMKELLCNPKTCALILYKLICMEEDDVDEPIWSVVEKVVTAGQDYELTVDEENLITNHLLGKPLHEKYPIDIFTSRRKVKVKKYKLSEQNELKKKLETICKNCESEEEIEMLNEKNSEERQIHFSSYLAPIIAAICEYHESNPFFINTNIWKKKINVRMLSGIGRNDEYCKKLSKYFAILNVYCGYAEELECVSEKEMFLEKYEAFCYQLIYKIEDPRNPAKEDKRIQYYTVEQLIGMKLFEVETDIIYKNISEKQDMLNERSLNRNYGELRDILSKIYSFSGAITKIVLAESILKEYFKRCAKIESEKRDREREIRKDLLKKIEYEDLKFKLRERIYLEDIFGEENQMSIGMIRKKSLPINIDYAEKVEGSNEKTYISYIDNYFKEYKDRADKINNTKEKSGLTPKKLMDLAKNKIASDEKRNIIKKWVICKSIFNEILRKVEFVSGDDEE